MNKRSLYESIMKNVAKEVKKSLNETLTVKDSLETYLPKILNDKLGRIWSTTSISSPVNLNEIDMKALAKTAAGQIVELVVASRLENSEYGSKFNVKHNKFSNTYDFTGEYDGETFNLEVKAFKGNSFSNITFTSKQMRDIMNGETNNTFYLLVSYIAANSGIDLSNFYLVTSDEMRDVLMDRVSPEELENKGQLMKKHTGTAQLKQYRLTAPQEILSRLKFGEEQLKMRKNPDMAIPIINVNDYDKIVNFLKKYKYNSNIDQDELNALLDLIDYAYEHNGDVTADVYEDILDQYNVSHTALQDILYYK